MATLKSGASSDQLTIDPTSKAARVTLYDEDGNNLSPRDTYRASTAAVFAAAAGTAPFFALYGSATKTIKIKRIVISGVTLTAVAYLNINIGKYSTAITGGTATALTQTPLDSNSPAATPSLVNVYTAAPTAGTKVGDVSTRRHLGQATTAAAAGIPEEIIFDFNDFPVVLRGTTQGIAAYFTGAPASAVSMALTVVWSEE